MGQETVTSAEKFRKRSGVVFIVLIVWAGLAAAHIFYYSWFKRDKLLKESLHLAWREGTLPSLRGRILSADSRLLAWTELTHDLILRKTSPKAKRFEELIRQLTDALPDLSPDEKEDFILLKQNISPDEILKIEKVLSGYSELAVVPRMTRRTIGNPAVRRLLGTTDSRENDPSLKGKDGLEKKYDDLLAGKPGTFRVMLDRSGNWVSGTIEITVPPENGKDVTLTEPFEALANRKENSK